MAQVLQRHAETLANIAILAEKSAEAARIAQTAWVDAVAHIDAEKTKEKENALLQNETLRAAVANQIPARSEYQRLRGGAAF